jgi:hypothetical protein
MSSAIHPPPSASTRTDSAVDIEVEIQTADADTLLRATTGREQAARGDQVDLGDGAGLRLLGVQRDKAIGAADLIMFALSIPSGVATTVIAEAINRRLRRARQLTAVGTVRLVIHEQEEAVDAQGNRTMRTITRYEEIPLANDIP